MKKKYSILFSLIILTSNFLQAQINDRSLVSNCLAPFYHGVASGDPTSNSVIIWTRITTTDLTATVNWKIATDTMFSSVVNSGIANTDGTLDYTIKVDVSGLSPDTWYYYQFESGGMKSIIGRTHTAPIANNNLRFAVLACSNYQSGFFNAYNDIVNKNDVDAIVHLGDYIYEYGTSDFDPTTDTSRLHIPANEITTLSDYRMRYSHYHLDPDLMRLHQLFPFICIWDDHEVANDAWRNGADNHTEGTEGLFVDRKANARKAYFEWIPIRDIYGTGDTIHRTFKFGSLAEFIMLDTRNENRDEQIGTSGAAVEDTNRILIGPSQLNWFKNKVSNSTSRWKLIGNQVMISPLKIAGVAVNQDQWDGYPAERDRVLYHLKNNNIDNVVFLTGDIHTSWAMDIAADYSTYNATTGAGSDAVEFVCTSVTSTSFINFTVPVSVIQFFNPNIKYAELSKRGYIVLDIDTNRVQADWVYVNDVWTKSYTSSTASSWKVLNNNKHLVSATALSPRNVLPSPQSFCSNSIGIDESTPFIGLHCYPNPAISNISLQYFLNDLADIQVEIVNLDGKLLYSKTLKHISTGIKHISFDVNDFAKGVYIVKIKHNNWQESRQIIIQ